MDMHEQDQEVIREFLVESHENLSRLDQELVELEQRPQDAALLGGIFRTIHTIKGSCGFLAFSTLERITHQAESILSQLRDGHRDLSPALVSLILETVDATRKVLASIEETGQEGTEPFDDLTERLRAEAQRNTRKASPPVAPPLKAEEEITRSSAVADANIRVGVELLDKLMDLVGELVLTRNQILQFNSEREDAALNATSQRLNLITSELQEGVMKTRMQPIGVVWNKLPRVVRDMALALGKQIRIEMDGTETELDRNIMEAIKDPLVHLVRNACDHGVEKPEVRLSKGKTAEGVLTLRAFHEGGQVNIEIGDDGAGINVERVRAKAAEKGLFRSNDRLTDREILNLVFCAGLSTAEKVTNVSGRGVGMDVVKSNIEKIGGVVDLVSRPDAGTTVKLKIPLTLAIIPGLVIASGGERFVIPQVSLLELIRIEADSKERCIEYVHGTPVYRRRGGLLPVVYLNRILELDSKDNAETVSIVVLQAEDRQFGLVVDSVNDTQEIVVKPLSKQLKGLAVYAGATIMGDGRVALILDVPGIGQRSGVLAELREQTRAGADQKAVSAEVQRLLLFRGGSFERLALPLALVSRLEEFPLTSIERSGGRRVVQYRDRILPLVTLGEVLDLEATASKEPTDPAQVIVFTDGDRSVGLMVDQIIDIAEEAVTVRRKTGRKGLLGSAVVGKQVTDFLDLTCVIEAAVGNACDGPRGAVGGRSVLVAESSAFSRGLIRGGLDMAGYRVVEAASVEEALRKLEQQRVDLVVAALALPSDGCAALRTAMRKKPEWESIPMLALADSADEMLSAAHGNLFEDCQAKYDRRAMLESLARLAEALGPGHLEPVRNRT